MNQYEPANNRYIQLFKNSKKGDKIGLKCQLCGADMVTREGAYGKFLGCENYPKTKCDGKYVLSRGELPDKAMLHKLLRDTALEPTHTWDRWGGEYITHFDDDDIVGNEFHPKF